jgi:hypothetical protein
MYRVVTDADGKTVKQTINRGKRKLVNLVDFDARTDKPAY